MSMARLMKNGDVKTSKNTGNIARQTLTFLVSSLFRVIGMILGQHLAALFYLCYALCDQRCRTRSLVRGTTEINCFISGRNSIIICGTIKGRFLWFRNICPARSKE